MPSKSSGEALRLDQALAAPVGAGVPVGARDGFAVVLFRDVFGGLGSEMDRAVGVVDRLLRVAQHEACARFLARIVTGVGLREGEPELQTPALRCATRPGSSIASPAWPPLPIM